MTRENINLARITSERRILYEHLRDGKELDTRISVVHELKQLDEPKLDNPVSADVLGVFRKRTAAKAVIADMSLLKAFTNAGLKIPAFSEAGPRKKLHFDPHKVQAAIVTTGGIAPGLNSVIHSIVKRHIRTYSLFGFEGRVLGVYNSFRGLCDLAANQIELNPTMTEEWLEHGGSKLGNIRYYPGGKPSKKSIAQLVRDITTALDSMDIDILYVIGGDGSLSVAHQLAIAPANKDRSIVGIPKTMDNDILWVWQSFGFDTAVEQATRAINTLRSEAESTRRICLIELFGAEAGFVAANAALASGHVDLVLIPEVFNLLDSAQVQKYLDDCIKHIKRVIKRETHNPHAVVVVAEGVGTVLEKKKIVLGGKRVKKGDFVTKHLAKLFTGILDAHRYKISTFDNQPRHHIRAVPANAHDQIYCERLGALAVDNALAGYTDCMISNWLTEFVLVPLHLVGEKQKSVPIHGMFWKQVVSSAGQPLSPAEIPAENESE